MRKIAQKTGLIVIIASIYGCGGGGSDNQSQATPDNSANQAFITSSIGYSGGNVVFGGVKIVGEWSATKTKTVSGSSDSFKSSTSYMVLSVKFDDSRYLEYWSSFGLSPSGSVVSNAAWTPIGSYGVSQDGSTLVVDKYSSRKSFKVKDTHQINGKPCVLTVELESSDEYDLCKVS